MIFRVEFAEQAAYDLDGILSYISDELCNPDAAERFRESEKLLETAKQAVETTIEQGEEKALEWIKSEETTNNKLLSTIGGVIND